jgi:hypothetical protein
VFKTTIRTGVDPTGYVIKPPMPITSLQNLPDVDLEAIFRFLQAQKPIKNAVGRTREDPNVRGSENPAG